LLALEHGSDQAAAVAVLLARSGFARITQLDDRSGRPRVTLAQLQKAPIQSTPNSINPQFNQPREPS
jgi:hypothetical protein